MAHLRRCGVAISVVAILIALLSTSETAAESAYDRATLQAYVSAWIKVDRLKGQLQQRIDQTRDRMQKIALARKSDAEIKAAIEATPGITFVKYQEIRKAARDDPALMQRITNIAE